MSLQRSWAAHPPPDERPQAHDAHAPYLMHLMTAISDLTHSNGRIEARLERGDTMFQEIKDDLADVKGELSALKTAFLQGPLSRLSRILALKSLLETLARLRATARAVKEAWPFLAVIGAAVARWLGYDPAVIFGHP